MHLPLQSQPPPQQQVTRRWVAALEHVAPMRTNTGQPIRAAVVKAHGIATEPEVGRRSSGGRSVRSSVAARQQHELTFVMRQLPILAGALVPRARSQAVQSERGGGDQVCRAVARCASAPAALVAVVRR